MKGWKHTEETKLKIRNSRLGEKNHRWVGDRISYNGIHWWVRRNKPKSKFCEKCFKEDVKLECANISGLYKRDINDFKWLCRSCHSKEHRGKDWHLIMLKKKKEAMNHGSCV